MEVRIIGTDWCPKCKQAKAKLLDFPNVRYIDAYSESGKRFVSEFDIKFVPFIVIYHDDGEIEADVSILHTKSLLENVKKE